MIKFINVVTLIFCVLDNGHELFEVNCEGENNCMLSKMIMTHIRNIVVKNKRLFCTIMNITSIVSQSLIA